MLNIFKKNTIFGRNTNSDLPLYYDDITVEGETTQETSTQNANLFDENYYNNDSIYTSGTYKYVKARFSGNKKLYFKASVKEGKSEQSGPYICISESAGQPYIGGTKSAYAIRNGSITNNVVDFTGVDELYINVYPNTLNVATIFDNYNLWISTDNINYVPFVPDMPSPEYPSDLVSVGYENIFNESQLLDAKNWSLINGYYNGTMSALNAEFGTLTDGFIFDKSFEANAIYTISFNAYVSDGVGLIRVVYTDNSELNMAISNTMAQDFSYITSGKTISKIIGSYNSGGPKTLYIKDFQITKGSSQHSYIPYGKYGVEIEMQGNNLFNSVNNKGLAFATGQYFNENGSSSSSDFIKINSNVYSSNYRFIIYYYDENKNYLGHSPSLSKNGNGIVIEKIQYIPNNSNVKYFKVWFRPIYNNDEDMTTKDIMLNEGTESMNYEPNIEHTNLIVLDSPLRSIGKTKDLLYIKNDMLFIERKIGLKIISNGSFWEDSSWNGYVLNMPQKINQGNTGLLSNKAKYVYSYSQRQENTVYENPANIMFVGNKNDTLQTMKQKYDGSELYYILASPTIETYELDTQPMIFDSLGYGTLSDVVSDPLITEELNGSYILELEYMKNGKFSEYLVEENIIKAHGEPFSIYSVEKDTDEKIKILAKHWVINEWDKDFILDSAPTDLTAQNALAWIQQRSINHSDISISGDCTATSTARYVRKNMLSAIFKEDNAILTRFGGELSYNKNNVSVNKHRGSLSGLTIRQGKNLTGAKYYLDFSTVTTRLVPVGKDGLMLDEVYVDSPLINNYATPIIRKVEVNTTSKDELRSYCNKLYENGLDKPTVSIKIDFIELSKTDEYKQYSSLETAHLGDEVIAYIPSLNLNVSTRIVKTVYNDNLKRITALELGSVTPNIATSSVNVEKNLQKQVEQLAANDSLILDEAKEEASNLIKHPFGGYIYIDDTTGNMYIMDTNDINTAQNVWRWGLGGLGFSSTGVNGTYGIAMTQDGKIVADYIKSGTLQSVTIKATNGTVGGYKIGENKLYAETYSSYNFDSSDLTAIRNYLMDEGSLSDDELIKYDIDGNGVVNSRDYVLIRNFIELGVTKNKSAKIIMQTGNNIFENAYILQDANENDILNINFNGFMYDHPNNGKFNLSGSKLTLTDINNNSMTISPDWLPKSVLSNWYSTSSTTLTDAKKHKLLVILGKPTSSSGIVSLIIPTDALSTSNQQFQCADESKYVAFNVRYNNDDVIITGAGRSSDGSILSAWTLL